MCKRFIFYINRLKSYKGSGICFVDVIFYLVNNSIFLWEILFLVMLFFGVICIVCMVGLINE